MTTPNRTPTPPTPYEPLSIDTSYGVTRVWRLVSDPNAPCVALFHGVHSTGEPRQGSKYALLAEELHKAGCSALLMETSRRPVDRARLLQRPELRVLEGFRGKTFDQEREDGFAALKLGLKDLSPSALTLWGFSLGGILAILTAVDHPGCNLVLCGTGAYPRERAKDVLRLPILSTLPPQQDLRATAEHSRPKTLRAYWGTEDATFDEGACRSTFDALICDDKNFTVCDGADHGFRRHKGQPDDRWLRRLLADLTGLALGQR